MNTKLCLIIALFFLPVFSLIAQEAEKTAIQTAEQQYLQKKKTAKGLLIGGGASLAASIGLLVLAESQGAFDIDIYGSSDDTNGEFAAIAGSICFLGGTGLLIAGIITNSKANKMKPAGMVQVLPYAPAVRPANTSIPQSGITVRLKLR